MPVTTLRYYLERIEDMTTGSTALGLLEDDDIFARPPRAVARQQAKSGHITCRVCGRPATVPLDHPALLCPLCLMDLDTTRARVAQWLESALARLDANDAQWRATLDASPAQDAWARVQGALIAVAEKRATQADLDRTWAKRKAEGGDLAKLLIAWEGYAQTADSIGAELAKLHLAQTEINTAWLSNEL